ncbi:MAG: adenosylcobalamin-dependent ribonucleoside-diphosphate reductase [Ktedonobacterales bacterium]
MWRHLSDLQVGEWVALQKNTYPDSTDYRFAPSDRVPHFNAKQIKIPDRPTAELGEFIGYLIGDGCINYYNSGGGTGRVILTIADAEPEVASRLLYLANELFGVTATARKKPNDASTNYFFTSTELAAWLKHIGVTKPSTLDVRVPEAVFAAGAELARGFLRGLFTADGTITKDGYAQLYSISRALVEDVQQLLLALGIPSSITVNERRETSLGKNPVYKLRPITRAGMREFAEQIGFMAAAKNDRLDAGLDKAWEFNDVIPNQQRVVEALYDGPGRGSGPDRGSRGADRELYHDIAHYLPNVAAPRHLTRSRLRELAEKHEAVRNSALAVFLTNDQFYDQVVSVADDEAVTVDLSVEENHTYIANGFVSHNTRRGANMGILRVDHPDVLQFIDCKRDGSVTNFNISVAITDEFMRALEADSDYSLVDPHTGKVVEQLRARDVMEAIVSAAWATGDPGLVFLDRANRSTANPTPEIEPLEATNPCGEQYLGPYDACNLGSINLGVFVHGGEIDWTELERVTRVTTRFLDDVIEINPFPLPEVYAKVHANRRIGLGVMGWAEMLFELGLPYDSDEAVALGERVMCQIREWASDESHEMAEERGAFPNFPRSIYKDGPELRNSTCTTVAPTGSISILADCSSGIEPIFALAFQHRVKQPDGTYRVLDFVNPFFQRALENSDIPDKEGVLEYVRKHGTLHGHADQEHPALKPYVTAHEIAPDWHIRMQASFQKGVDNSISKCLAGGTLIPTSRGLMAIEDFSSVEEPDTFMAIADQGITVGGHRVLSHYYAGEKAATRIRLDNGSELVGSTESHRVYTPDGWKRMADLRVGDLVTGRFEEAHGPGGATLPVCDTFRTNAKPVTFPEDMTPQLAQFLGMLAADGHMTLLTGAVGLTSADEEVIGEFKLLAQQLFGLTLRHTIEKRNGNVQYLTLNSRALCRWVRELIGEGAYTKHVPAQVLAGSEEEKLAFLRGISLDGYYYPQYGLYVYSGMSKQLAYGVAEMCRSFGLPLVRVHTGLVASTGNIAYKVLVSNELQERIMCIERHKNREAHYATYQVLVDQELVSRTKLPTSHPYYGALSSIKQRQPRNCDNRTAERLGWSSETPVFRVTAVEDAGILSLYDIEVEDAHEYVVNGIVSHNTINLPNSATYEDVREAYMLAWNLGCLGITIFRDGSKGEQVLNVGVKEPEQQKKVDAELGQQAELAEPVSPHGAIAEPVAPLQPVPPRRAAPSAPLPQPPQQPGAYPGGIKPRPEVMSGYTRQVRAPEGTVNITLNSDADGLFEVFVNVGKAGSDISALAEALGRLISRFLQIDSPLTQDQRAAEVGRQLSAIGGSTSIGFGPNRVRSLPDAVARALYLYLNSRSQSGLGDERTQLSSSEEEVETTVDSEAQGSWGGVGSFGNNGNNNSSSGPTSRRGFSPATRALFTVTGNLCPQCGNNTLYMEEGCKKCVSCGYSEC